MIKKKFHYQDYSSINEKINELFDGKHIAETDGVFYLARESLNEANCIQKFLTQGKKKTLQKAKSKMLKANQRILDYPLYNLVC